jgi:hypothetical protein
MRIHNLDKFTAAERAEQERRRRELGRDVVQAEKLVAASHAARNAALASSRLSATPPFGPCIGARTRDEARRPAAARVLEADARDGRLSAGAPSMLQATLVGGSQRLFDDLGWYATRSSRPPTAQVPRALLRPLWRGRPTWSPNARLPQAIAGFRAQGRLSQLSARSGLKHSGFSIPSAFAVLKVDFENSYSVGAWHR